MTANPVLLVGGTGRVGRMVRHHWPNGAGLLVSRRRDALRDDEFLWQPLQGSTALLRQLDRRGVQPKALVMLAGVTPAPGVDAVALQGNTALAVACLTAARDAGIGRVLLASSSAVYGVDAQGNPFDEGARPAPVSDYGVAKLAMEAAAEPFRQAGLQVCALRIGNVAGADALLHPLSRAMTDPTQPRIPLRIDTFADGQGPLRSYIGAETMGRVLAELATRTPDLPAVLNLAAPCPVRMTALAEAAGWPFDPVSAPKSAHQTITLMCRHLAALCQMKEKDSDPAAMVAQWKATLPR